jgi:hypothetical protein
MYSIQILSLLKREDADGYPVSVRDEESVRRRSPVQCYDQWEDLSRPYGTHTSVLLK